MPFILEKRTEFIPRKRTSAIPKLRLSSALAPVDGMNHASKPKVDPILITPVKRITNADTTRVLQPCPTSTQVDPNCVEEVAILELVPFCKQPIVNFGEVRVNQSHTKSVAVRNLNNSQQRLITNSCPKPDKGFNMDATEFLLAPRTETYITIEWTPKVVGPCRETITFHDINRHPKRIVLVGLAVAVKPPPRASATRFFRRNIPTVRVHKSPVKALRTPSVANLRPLTKLNSSSIRRQSGLMIQKMLKRGDDQMAIKAQSHWRSILARRHLETLKLRLEMVIRLQSYWRTVIARRQLGGLKTRVLNAIKLQSHWRSILAHRHLEDLKMRLAMTIRSQSYWRMVLAQRQLNELKTKKSTVIKIQSYCRSILARRHLESLKLRLAMVIRLQSCWRMVLARRQLEGLKMRVLMAIKVQSHWRSVLAQMHFKELSLRLEVIIRLQAYCKMIIAKRRLNVISSLIKMERIINGARQDWQDSASPAKLERVFLELEQAQTRLDVCL